MRVNYTLSKEFCDAEFVRTGQRPDVRQALELDVNAATPEQRRAVVTLKFQIEPPVFGGSLANRLGKFHLPDMGNRLYLRDLESPWLLDTDDAWGIIETMAADLPGLQAEADARRAKAEAKAKAYTTQRKQDIDAAREARLQREALEDARLRNIQWRDDGTAVHDLYDALVRVAGIEQDDRFGGNWVKRVNHVCQTHDNGWDIEGEWLEPGTVELHRDTRAVYLVAGTSGSRKHNMTYYRVVVLEDGAFRRTAIATDNRKSGWALRIRDDLKALLAGEPA